MNVILPTGSMAQSLYHDTAFFTEARQLAPVSLDCCVELMFALFEDEFSERFYWTQRTNLLDSVLEEKIPWWCMPAHVEHQDDLRENPFISISNDYFCHVLDKYYLMLSGFMDEYLGGKNTESMWRVWQVVRLGRDVALQADRDYRIIDWETKIQSGEWHL